MKKFLTLLAVFTIVSVAQAQYVNIPDSNFRSFLKTTYPGCFNAAGLMDTSCNNILSEETLYFSGPYTLSLPINIDLDGLQYFKHLRRFGFFGHYNGTDTLNIPGIAQTVNEIEIRYAWSIKSLTSFPDSLKKISFSDCFHHSPVPSFPPGVKEISFSSCQMPGLPPLPDSLSRLQLYNVNVENLSALPAKLKFFFLKYNNLLVSLPALPGSLDTFFCNSTLLTQLPPLPRGLRLLNCSENNLLSLPQLPDSLKYLDCSMNDSLASIPSLPEGLNTFICQNYWNGLLTSLPPLPSSLTGLVCTGNSLEFLPELTPNLSMIDCSNNKLQALPSIPASVRSLLFQMNKIRVLPDLPNSLRGLSCGMNPLYNLPNHLPDSLESLDCGYDSLSSLPLLPPGLISLSCNDNLLTSLPPLPNLGYLYCQHNNIYCLPKLPLGKYNDTQFYIDMDKITCVPNRSPYVKFMIPNPHPNINLGDYIIAAPPIPLCNPTNNVSQCHSFPIMTGYIFYDNNNNGTKDIGENYKSNVRVELSNGAIAYTNNNGYFEIGTDSLGTYTINPTAPNYYNIVPSSATYHFTTYDTIVSKEYALQANSIKDSLAIKLTAVSRARPGFSFPYLISFENAGTSSLSSNVIFNYDNTKLSYDSSSNTTVSNDGTKLSLDAGNIVPGQRGSFIAYFKVKPTAIIGDSIASTTTISSGTIAVADSTVTLIRGSFDPNDKQATPQLTPLQVANGDYIDYTIRFQNTGTDTAFNIVISDTLSSDLQAGSFEIMKASHNCKTSIKNGVVYFEFLNILLPDKNINEPKSHGFVSFRIKPQSSVVENSTITNQAAIYFDYNAPVITNTAGTFIKGYTIVSLKLVSFTAVPQYNNSTALSWSTSNEINARKFVVEQSNDAYHFTTVATVLAKGSTTNHYNSTVNDLNNSVVYYRLKMVELDGTFTFSPVIKIDRRKNTAGFSVLSNPVKDVIIINTTDRNLNNSACHIINSQGAVVKSFVIQLGSETISIKGLPPGIYYLRTANGNNKILVQ